MENAVSHDGYIDPYGFLMLLNNVFSLNGWLRVRGGTMDENNLQGNHCSPDSCRYAAYC